MHGTYTKKSTFFSIKNHSFINIDGRMPTLVVAWSKAWVYGCSLARIVGLNPA